MRIYPAQTERDPINGFTFPEILTALVITVLTVYATASALMTILRQDDTGLHALRGTLAMQQTACRHFLAPDALPEDAAEPPLYFQSVQALQVDSWVIYTLTPADDSASMALNLALKFRKDTGSQP